MGTSLPRARPAAARRGCPQIADRRVPAPLRAGMGLAMDHTDFVGRIDVTPALNDDEAAHVARFARSRTNGCSWTPCPDGCCLGLDQPARAGVAGGVAALPAHRRARVRPSARRRAGRVPAADRGAVLGLGREQPGAREGAARRTRGAQAPRRTPDNADGRGGHRPRRPASLAPVSAQTPASSLSSARIVVDLAPQREVPLVVEQVRSRVRHVRGQPLAVRERHHRVLPAVPDRHRHGDRRRRRTPTPPTIARPSSRQPTTPCSRALPHRRRAGSRRTRR